MKRLKSTFATVLLAPGGVLAPGFGVMMAGAARVIGLLVVVAPGFAASPSTADSSASGNPQQG